MCIINLFKSFSKEDIPFLERYGFCWELRGAATTPAMLSILDACGVPGSASENHTWITGAFV